MKIAVTGANGFIGTELIRALTDKKDVEVIALTRGATDHTDTSFCVWKTTDYTIESLAAVLKGADVVIHSAGVRGTSSDPDDYIVNEVMTETILRAMAIAGVRRMVFASSISVYDDEKLLPWREDAVIKGRTAYGDSKIRCEKLIADYAKTCGFSYAIARIAQVTGLGERRRGIMNVFIDTAREHGTLNVIGKSVARRQFIYVKDLVEILITLATGSEGCDPKENQIVNVGMREAYTNLELAEIVNRVFENPAPIEYRDSSPETTRSSYMDTDRLLELTGYTPRDMEQTLMDIRRSV